MSKHRLLGGVAATALTIGGMATLTQAADAAAGTASVVVVTPASHLMDFSDTRTKGHNDFLEDGLHVYTEGTTSQDKAAGYLTEDRPLDSFGEPTMEWTLTDPSLPAQPGLQLVVDFDDNGSPDGILVGESRFYGNVWWLANGAQFVKDGSPHNGGGYGSAWYGTLDEWRAAFPTAQDRGFGYSLGSGVHGDGILSQLTLGETTYRFAAGLGPCEAEIDESTKTYTLTKDCSTFTSITVPDGWTLDGAGHTLTGVEDATHTNFPGPIVTSAVGDSTAATMHVTDLDIATSGFENGSNSGGQLSGIRFYRAGGSVTHVTVDGISHGNGVQEGIGIYVRDASAGAPPAALTLDDVEVTNYQKSGIVVNGDVDVSLTHSTVGAVGGPNGETIPNIAGNSVQLAFGAHGTVTDNHIALNEYDPQPPPGDGSDATAFLVYDATDVTFQRNVVSGGNGDVGMDVYNDTAGTSTVTVSCNLFSRDEQQGDSDPYGIGIATYADSAPVDVQLSDTTFIGWTHDTAEISYDDDGNAVFGPGATNETLGECPPSAPANVSAPGGDEETDVSWTGSTAPEYAPLGGYTVTATDDNGTVVASEDVAPDTTTTHLTGLTRGVDYTISVVATSAGGTSAAASTVLHATFITLVAGDERVGYGNSTVLFGTLSTTGSAPLAGRQVLIERRDAGSGEWTTLATVSVDASGGFAKTVKPTANTEYRATYAGAPDNSSVSAPVLVNVAMKLKVRVSATKLRKGDRVLFSGSVAPKHAGYPVRLQLQDNDGVAWITVNAVNLDKKSRFGLRYKLKAVGEYVFRVVADGDLGHVDGVSKTFVVKVS